MAAPLLKDFSTTNLTAWVEANIRGGQRLKTAVIEAFKDNELTGKDIVQIQTASYFQDLEITALMSNRLYDGFKAKFPNEFGVARAQPNTGNANAAVPQIPAQQVQERTEAADNTDDAIAALLKRNQASLNQRGNNNCGGNTKGGNNTNTGNNANDNSYSFQVSIFVGSVRKKTKNFFRLNSTVLQLKQEIATNEAGGDASDVRLTFNAKPLQDNRTLEQSGIINSMCFVTAIVRVHGGAAIPDEKDEKTESVATKNTEYANIRHRCPHFSTNKNIKPTLEPDCVTFEDSTDQLRVKMPCGHVFSPLTIYKWCQRTLHVYSKDEVSCPILECNKEWKIADIVSGGDLDDNEHGSLVNVLNNRKLMRNGDYKQCPGCTALVELSEKEYMFRVRCNSQVCQKKNDFCWICNQVWKGTGVAVCGNKNCHTNNINDQLKIENCGTTTAVMGRTDVTCPKRRACPRCLSITEYKEACKHMVCWQCKRSFCFICLALAGKEVHGYGQNWACEDGDNYAGKCKLAPVQVLT